MNRLVWRVCLTVIVMSPGLGSTPQWLAANRVRSPSNAPCLLLYLPSISQVGVSNMARSTLGNTMEVIPPLRCIILSRDSRVHVKPPPSLRTAILFLYSGDSSRKLRLLRPTCTSPITNNTQSTSLTSASSTTG